MTWCLYDYVNQNGVYDFKIWTQGLENRLRAKLNAKLDMLVRVGPDLPPGLLSHTRSPHIRKLRIKGNIALRPMLCEGPVNIGQEFTLLLGAHERDRKLVPEDADHNAEVRRQEILRNPKERRCDHERVR